MNTKFTKETFVRIYDDDGGNFYQVGPDRDSLDLCEISSNDGDQRQPTHYVTIPWKAAKLLAEAILEVAPLTPEEE